jgi:hypothetical protein
MSGLGHRTPLLAGAAIRVFNRLMRGNVVLGLALAALAALTACEKGGPATEPADARHAGGACVTDADCRLVDDYCTGCDCRALGRTDPDPTCSGPGVQCLVAPCASKKPACQAGQCAAASVSP